MTIPNAVGRIDAITEAIREGDRFKAQELLAAEGKRLAAASVAARDEFTRREQAFSDVMEFLVDLDKVWNQARIDCGHNPEIA